jgi:hypothetical protein
MGECCIFVFVMEMRYFSSGKKDKVLAQHCGKVYLVFSCDLKKFTLFSPFGLFSSKIFCKINTIALSFVFDKYYQIMD